MLWHTVDDRPAKTGGTPATVANDKASATVAVMKVTPGFRVDPFAAMSLMPSGILENLPADEFLALIAFLTAKP